MVGAVGIVACFIDPLQGVIMLALDGLSTLFLLAGGIVSYCHPRREFAQLILFLEAFAATLKVGNCTNEFYLADHQKTFFASDQKYAFLSTKQAENDVISRCRMSQADTALIWFTLACAAGAVALSFMSHKSGRGSIV